jgi:hypothetical protein
MRCPKPEQYQQWIQKPKLCFAEPDLKAGHVARLDSSPLPKIVTGKFACVFEVANGAQRWAVRCFKRTITDQEQRYACIGAYLAQKPLPSLAEFTYVSKGIQVNRNWWPIVKMAWVDGECLDRYVGQNLFTQAGRARLVELVHQWRALISSLRSRRIAHGDLHHDNILITPGGCIRLVDYDGMFVPGLERSPSRESGHPNYQHPGRQELRCLNQEIDNFAAALIYLSLRAVAVEPQLWTQCHQQDCLLLNERDFKGPDVSKTFARLKQSPDDGVRRLAERLMRACGGPFACIPVFEQLVADLPEKVPLPAQAMRPKYIAQQGLANYRSLREAVAEAEPGAQLVVRAGRYIEALVLDKPLLITGEGPADKIIVQAETHGASALTLNRAQVMVTGLTLYSYHMSDSAVTVRDGRLTLEDCNVWSASQAGVYIDGSTASAMLRRCRIAECGSSGVLLDNQGRVEIEDSQLAGNKTCGIEVKNGSSARLLRCAVVDNRFEAVWIHENCAATVEDCELTGNERGAWDIRKGAITQRKNNFPDEQLLLDIFHHCDLPRNVYLTPNIPDHKLNGAKSSCCAPNWEKILLLVDFSVAGYAVRR